MRWQRFLRAGGCAGAVAGLVLLGAPALAGSGGEARLGQLVPGVQLGEAELGSVYGRGVVFSFDGGRIESADTGTPTLRKSIMGAMSSAGVRPTLNPSGVHGTAGSSPATADLPTLRINVDGLGNSNVSTSTSH